MGKNADTLRVCDELREVEERAPHSGAPRAAPLWRKLRFSTDIRV